MGVFEVRFQRGKPKCLHSAKLVDLIEKSRVYFVIISLPKGVKAMWLI